MVGGHDLRVRVPSGIVIIIKEFPFLGRKFGERWRQGSFSARLQWSHCTLSQLMLSARPPHCGRCGRTLVGHRLSQTCCSKGVQCTLARQRCCLQPLCEARLCPPARSWWWILTTSVLGHQPWLVARLSECLCAPSHHVLSRCTVVNGCGARGVRRDHYSAAVASVGRLVNPSDADSIYMYYNEP